MKTKSLQEIEDFYKNQGHKGDELRKILAEDKEWLLLLNERKRKLSQKIFLTKIEKKRYVMSTNEDYEILSKIKQIEKMKLTSEEKSLIKLIKTQLEHDWRKQLIQTLNKILRKYRKWKN